MDFNALILSFSSICSIFGFLLSLKGKGRPWLWAVILFILTSACGYSVHYNSELERIKDIHRQAAAIYEHYSPYGESKVFIQESLTFLEENKDRYPDAYERARKIYADTKNPNYIFYSDAASELSGILKAIAALNNE